MSLDGLHHVVGHPDAEHLLCLLPFHRNHHIQVQPRHLWYKIIDIIDMRVWIQGLSEYKDIEYIRYHDVIRVSK